MKYCGLLCLFATYCKINSKKVEKTVLSPDAHKQIACKVIITHRGKTNSTEKRDDLMIGTAC